MRIPSTIAVAAMLAAALAQPAASIMIDDFEVGDFSFTDDTTSVLPTLQEQSGLSTSSVVGGVRLVQITATGIAGASAAALATTPVDDGAVLTTLAGSGSYAFMYDGTAGGLSNSGSAGTLGLNLSGTTAVAIDATLATGVVDATVQMWSNTTQTSTFAQLVNGVTLIPVTNFSINMADIRAIRVNITLVEAGDVPIINSISTVPEPGTGLLTALGLVGLAIRRARSR